MWCKVSTAEFQTLGQFAVFSDLSSDGTSGCEVTFFVLDRVAEAWARGAAAAESREEDAAAGRGGRAEGVPDAGPAAGAGHGAGGAHTGEEGPVPQACWIPGHQPGKPSKWGNITIMITTKTTFILLI